MTKHVAIYTRVSTKAQDTKSQQADLEAWASNLANHDKHEIVKWYSDKASGKSFDRPSWNKLEQAINAGRVSTIVVWRLDRLGRTASGLTALFDELQRRRVNLVSLKDGLDLATAAGRLMANVLASVAQFETEIRAERILAGQAAARAKGKRWGGSKPGRRKVSATQVRLIRRMKLVEHVPIAEIAKAVKLSRPTIYSVLSSNP